MSTANEDLAQLLKKLEDWAGAVPAEAQEFHRRRLALVQQIRANTGTFGGRDEAQIAEILRKSRELDTDLPAISALYGTASRARNRVIELRSAITHDPRVRQMVDNLTADWLNLIDFLQSREDDRRAAETATSQMRQIETWSSERKAAVAILSDAASLRAQDLNSSVKTALDAEIRRWTDDFLAQRIDPRWLAEASRTLKMVADERAAARVDSKTVAPPKPFSETIATPEPEAPEEDQSRFHFYRIGQALADCDSLGEALHESRGELEKLEERYWQFQNRQQVSTADVAALEEEIQAYRDKLQSHANQEVERRLTRLQGRWLWFRAVYDNRPEIAAMVETAQAAKPDAANRLQEFMETVAGAEQRINAIVNANRPKLAESVRRTAGQCRVEIANLLGQAHLIQTDAALTKMRIPEPPDSQVNADQLFERLDSCQSLLAELAILRAENDQKRAEVTAHAARLKRLVGQLAGEKDAGETTATLALQIPEQLSADRSLDVTEAELNRLEEGLNGQLSRVHRRGADELLQRRKENQAWIRLLAQFVPDVEHLSSKDPAPEDLEDLRTALDVEARFAQRIVELSGVAALRLAERGKAALERLQHHLATPAFDTHPERETAQSLLESLQSVEELTEAPKREEFRHAKEAVEEAEDFIDRIEATQREIPERLAAVEESFGNLRELNGTYYRQELARRVNTLVMGTKKAIRGEEWEHLDHQLKEASSLLEALKRDALQRISAETTEVVERLETGMRTCNDAAVVRQIQSAFDDLRELGPFVPPPYALRQRLTRLERRTASARH